MIPRLSICLVCLLLLSPELLACSVSGCIPDDGKMPVVRFRLLNAAGQQLALYDSSSDEGLTLPNFLRTPMPDGSFVIEYLGSDRRASYGEVEQRISIQFADLLPPDEIGKHPEGRAEAIPVGEGRALLNWTGRATYLTMHGVLEEGDGNPLCSWFCRLDIRWVGSFPDASPSMARLKALYEDSVAPAPTGPPIRER